MKTMWILTAILASTLVVAPATAGEWNGYAKAQQRLAKIQQHRSTYLPRRYQTSNVIDTAAGFRKGAAWLIRSKNGIDGRIMTNVPTAGDPYTLWVIAFNNPGECAADVCEEADIFNPKVRASIFNASGAISADNGRGGGALNFDFNIVAGNLPNGWFVLAGEGDGLLRNRGFKAQIALVVDKHDYIAPGGDSWIEDLTATNFPGEGDAVNNAIAIFLPCREAICPASIL